MTRAPLLLALLLSGCAGPPPASEVVPQMEEAAGLLGARPLSFQVTNRCGPADEALGGFRLTGVAPLPDALEEAVLADRLTAAGFDVDEGLWASPPGGDWSLEVLSDGDGRVLVTSAEVDGPLPHGLPEPLPCG